tara:strand:+ start:1171 stop:1446 length:276 start_codon:yes stop_codon:yes gene_type:complete
MCVGGLFGGGRRQQPVQPQRQQVAPTMKAAAPPAEMVSPEKIKDEAGDEDKLSTKKKKALEIKKVKEGVKTFGAINPASLPDTPSGGVNTP